MKAVRSKSRVLPIALGIASIGVTGPSWSADTGAGAKGPQAVGIEEVIVTARKREEASQTVPVTITAFSPKDLQNKAIQQAYDLGTSVTGLVATMDTTGNLPTFAIRSTRTQFGVDNAVAIYFDEVPIVMTVPALWYGYDLASVEVDKGPQGTLFGVNTTGGAIVFHPNRPTDQFEGYVEGGYGNYNRRYGEAMVNIPISEKLQIRVAGTILRRDGFQENIAPNRATPRYLDSDEHETGRVSINFKPTDKVSNLIVADWFHEHDTPASVIPFQYTPTIASYLQANYGLPASAFYLGRDKVNIGKNIAADFPTFRKQKSFGVSDTLNWDLNDHLSLKNVLAFRYDSEADAEDADGSPYIGVTNYNLRDTREFVEELSLHWDAFNKRLRGVSGFYYSRTYFRTINDPQAFQHVASPLVSNSSSWNKRNSESRAVYTQVDYDLSDELTLTVGGRYGWDFGSFKFSTRGTFGPVDTNPSDVFRGYLPCKAAGTAIGQLTFDPVSCIATNKAEWTEPSYNIVLTDKYNDHSLVYMKASGSYLKGGFNYKMPAFTSVFKPEITHAFEGGLKSDWRIGGRPIRTNIDGFYGTTRNKQEATFGFYTGGPDAFDLFGAVFNAGTLEFYGADFEVKYLPTDNLELNLGYTHVEASYINFTFPGVPFSTLPSGQLTGQHPAQVPKETLTLGATYTLPLPESLGKLSTSFNAYFRSKTHYNDAPNLCFSLFENYPCPSGGLSPSADVVPSYWLFDATVIWKGIAGSPIDATFWMKNILDKKYLLVTNPQGIFEGWNGQFGQPRTFGVNLRYNF